MSRMTYQEWIQKNPNPITDLTGDPLQKTIEDWFKYRYIGFENPDKFKDIFRRNIAVNMPIYNQKLRIEPGISQFDWLVQTYRERQLKTKGNGTATRTRGNDQTVVNSNETSEQGTFYNVDDKDTRYGSETHVKSGGHTEDFTEGLHTNNENFVAGLRTSEETAIDGLHTTNETSTEGLHTTNEKYVQGTHESTYAPHVGKKTQNGGHVSNWNGGESVSATLPMSKTYGNQIAEDELQDGETPESQAGYFKSRAYAGMPYNKTDESLDWETVSAQSQNANRAYTVDKGNTTESYVYGEGVKGDVTTEKGDEKNPDNRTTTVQGSSKNPDEKTTRSQGSIENPDKRTGKTSGSADNPDIRTGSRQGNSENPDKRVFNYDDETDKITYDDLTNLHTKRGNVDASTENNGNSTTTSSYGNITDANHDSRTDQEQATGRNEDPATILMRAQAYIEASSAFKWLKEQLEPCFAPWYDEEGGLI